MRKGFAITLPCMISPLIKNGEVYPVGLGNNQTFDENGVSKMGYRLTHSFPIKKGIAINDRVEKDKILDCSTGVHF